MKNHAVVCGANRLSLPAPPSDVFSYEEDDSVIDPQLAQHLAHFGIDFASLTKVEAGSGSECLLKAP